MRVTGLSGLHRLQTSPHLRLSPFSDDRSFCNIFVVVSHNYFIDF